MMNATQKKPVVEDGSSHTVNAAWKWVTTTVLLVLVADTAFTQSIEYPSDFACIQVPDPLSEVNPTYPLTPIPLPDVGTPFFDAHFGTILTRVTQTDGIDSRHEYSPFDPFNVDQTLIRLLTDQGYWKIYRTQAIPYNQDVNLVMTLDLSEPRWDRSQPNLIWGLDEFSIVAVDVMTGVRTVIKDFTQDAVLGPIISDSPVYQITMKKGGEASIDRRFWMFILQADHREDYASLYLFTWDRVADTVLGVYPLPESEREIDWVAMSPLGNWAIIGGEPWNGGNLVGLTMANKELTMFHRLAFDTAESDMGLDLEGNEVIVMQNTRTDYVDLIPIDWSTKPILEDGGSYEGTGIVPLIRLFYSSDSPHGFQGGIHISCNFPGYAVISTTLEPALTEQNWLDRTIVLVELNRADPDVFYLAKVYNTTQEYWEKPHATITNDGRKVVWASNWNQNVGQEQMFLMLLDMPPEWPMPPPPTDLPDLTVSEVSVYPPVIEAEQEVIVEALIENSGDAPAVGLVVVFAVDGVEIRQETIEFIEPGDQVVITATWTATAAGDHTLSVQVDPENRIREGNEENNEARLSITVMTGPEPSSTPTPTATPPPGMENCVAPSQFYEEPTEADLVELELVEIHAAQDADGNPLPVLVDDCTGDGQLDVFVPWTEETAAQKAVIVFSESVCEEGYPRELELMVGVEGSTTFRAYDGTGQLADTAAVTPAGGMQTVKFSSSTGIWKIEIQGAQICITWICWSCEAPTPSPTIPAAAPTHTPTELPPLPTDTPTELPPVPTHTPTDTPTPTPSPTPTPTGTPAAIPEGRDQIVLSHGYGGYTANKIIDPLGLTQITRFPGLPEKFAERWAISRARSTNTTVADIDADGVMDVVVAFGPGGRGSGFPSILLAWTPSGGVDDRPRVITTRNVFPPTARNSRVRNEDGALNLTAGRFFEGGETLIVAAQGPGGDNLVRVLQYMEKDGKEKLEYVGLFEGLTGAAAQGNTSGGTSVAAGDVDGDGWDELIVGQMNGEGATTLFQVVDLTDINPDPIFTEVQVLHRTEPRPAMPERFRGLGGVNLTVGDMNGDGVNEIITGSAGLVSCAVLPPPAKGRKGIPNDSSAAGRTVGLAGLETPEPDDENLEDLLEEAEERIPEDTQGWTDNPPDGHGIAPSQDVKPSGGYVRDFGVVVDSEQRIAAVKPMTGAIAVFPPNKNPSGGVDIAAGNLDDDAADELLIGTQAIVTLDEQWNVVLCRPAPRILAEGLNLEFNQDGTFARVSDARTPFVAFSGPSAPSSGAVNVNFYKETRPIQPPQPPTSFQMDGFTLEVESYDNYVWQSLTPTSKVIKDASGTAWTSFDCGTLPVVTLMPIEFEVVSEVENVTCEISVEEARWFDPDVQVGESLELNLPQNIGFDEPLRADRVAETMQVNQNLLGLLVVDKGKIRVRFENVTIEYKSSQLFPGGDYWNATQGSARYPTVPQVPAKYIELSVAGFKLYLHDLLITPSGATTKKAELEFPTSIISGADCRAAHVNLGEITITSDCQFHKTFATAAFGPWTRDNTGMSISGQGIVADFDENWAAPGMTDLTWRGAVLISGSTNAGPSGSIISNTGYLKAPYTFSNGLVTAAGLDASFNLTQWFGFKSFRPLGYDILIRSGNLYMEDSHITGGKFDDGEIYLPMLAVLEKAKTSLDIDKSVKAIFAPSGLSVQNDLDLYGEVTITQDLFWGELSKPSSTFYSISNLTASKSHFYLSAAAKEPYWPLTGAGVNAAFAPPNLNPPVAPRLEDQGIQGVTIIDLSDSTFKIFTPDTPNKAPISFKVKGGGEPCWLNVISRGVHARIMIEDAPQAQPMPDLGPTHKDSYVAQDPTDPSKKFPFKTALGNGGEFRLEFQFVDSAVYSSDVDGNAHLPYPTDDFIPFEDMQFTSSAHIAAASVVVPKQPPVELEHWGVELIRKPETTTSGVMCVKTGQIFLTAAGITERRHFCRPFYFIWGELLANGNTGRLIFDYNFGRQKGETKTDEPCDRQKFDYITFVPQVVALSAYQVGSASGYLHTAGTAHFDFFGEDYLNIRDHHVSDLKNKPPFDGRKIELCFEEDENLGTKPTDDELFGNWSNSFGELYFKIRYDDNDQDGFVGNGYTSFPSILAGDVLSASIVISSTRSCISVHDTNSHNVGLTGLANFAAIMNTYGCGCIESVENNLLKSFHLSSELKEDINATVLVRTSKYVSVEYLITPTISEMRMNGTMYLSVFGGLDPKDLEIRGQARFTLVRDKDYVDGEIEAEINVHNSLINCLSGEGRLEWHLGVDYQAIQGRVAVKVVYGAIGLGAEGAFFAGIGAPLKKAWVMDGANDGHFKFDQSALGDLEHVTGVYAYVKLSKSFDIFVLSGGVDYYFGLGAFISTNAPAAFILGQVGLHVWGDFLGGLASASAWGTLQPVLGYPAEFQGSVGIKLCGAWFFCVSKTVMASINSTDGFWIEVF